MSLTEDMRQYTGPLWQQVVDHPFVLELGDGTLSQEKFRTYFQQDYLFLHDWKTLLALAIAKSPDFDLARQICAFLNAGLIGEEALFQGAFRDMGLSPQDVVRLEPLPTTLAYSGFMHSIAYEGSFADIATNLLAIEWPYLEWAQNLNAAGKRPSDPYYQAWIDIHDSQGMRDIVGLLRGYLDSLPNPDTNRLQTIFYRALRYEYLFWEMPYRGEAWVS